MGQRPQIDIEALRRGGVVKLREKDMFAIWVKTACCNLTSRQLIRVADISENYGRGIILFTTRQIPIIPFIDLKDVEEVKGELAQVELGLDRCGPRVRNINVCYEDKICPEAATNSISLGEKLDRFFYSDIPHKIKIGVSGCRKNCVVCRVLSDIGFIGVERDGEKGYDAYVGGRLGLNPFVGLKMADCIPEEGCVRFVQNYFDLLGTEGRKGERAADLIHRLGAEKVRQELNRGLQEGPLQEPIKCETALEERGQDGKMILRIRATCGEVTSRQLRKIAHISARYGKGFVHFAVRGAPEIPCIDRKCLEDVEKALREVNLQILDKGIDNLQTCFGEYCTHSIVDTQSLLRSIEGKAEQLGVDNLDIRVSASGCPNSCGIAHLNDIGFFGVVEPEVDRAQCDGCGICEKVCKRKAIRIIDKIAVIDHTKCGYCGECIKACPVDAKYEKRKGYDILVGGREGEDTRLGQVIGEFLSEEEALETAEKGLRLLEERGANAAQIIDELGIDRFREELGVV